eukprot:1638207-Prymnesium_polylepis.1
MSQLAAQAARISDLRRLNDSRCAAAQSRCDLHEGFDELSAALRECSLVRYLNEAHLQAELDELLCAAAAGAVDALRPPAAIPSSSATLPPRTESEWLGAWADAPRG